MPCQVPDEAAARSTGNRGEVPSSPSSLVGPGLTIRPVRRLPRPEGTRMALMLDANFFIAVIAATIVSFVISGLWYGPVFGKMWMAALGRTEADKEAMRKQAPKGSVVGSFVLGILLQYARLANVGLPAGVAGGLVVGLLVWFGFPLFGMITGGIFEGRPGKLVGLNVSHALVSFLAMGLVLGIWV